MYCKVCGQEASDDIFVCPCCGSEIKTENIISENTDESVLGYSQNTYSDSIVFRHGKLLLIPIILGVIAGIIVLLCCHPGIKSTAIRFFSSPSVLMEQVYCNSIQKTFSQANTVSQWSVGNSVAAKYQMNIALGEEAISLLAASIDAKVEDIDGFSDVHISCDAAYQNNLLKAVYELSLKDQETITMEQYVDKSQMEQWIFFPELGSKPLFIDMNNQKSFSDIFGSNTQSMVDIAPKQLEEVSVHYISMLIDGFENVNKYQEKVNCNGISQRVTVLKAAISTKNLYQTQIAILEDATINPAVANIFYDIEKQTEKDYFNDFQTDIEQKILILERLVREEKSYSNFTLYTYLDRYNNIIGIKIEYSEEGIVYPFFSYVTVTKGDEYAVELSLWNEVRLEGVGNKGDRLNGSFSISRSNQLICTVTLKEFAYKNGYISGTISIIPDETIVEHLMDEAGCYQAYLQADRMKNFMIEIHMNLNSDHKETSISFYSNTKEISNISVSATLKEVMPDDFPEGVPDIDKYVDAENWQADIDENALKIIIERLANAGIDRNLSAEENNVQSAN